MSAIKYVFSGLGGALCGIFMLPMAIYPFYLNAAGGSDINGGIAMGMVQFVPVGAVIGAIAGMMLIGFLTSEPQTEEDKKQQFWNFIIFLGIAAALASVYFINLSKSAKQFVTYNDSPYLTYEISLDKSSVEMSEKFQPYVGSGPLSGVIKKYPTNLKIVDDRIILAGKINALKYDDTGFVVFISPDTYIYDELPLFPGAKLRRGFSKWFSYTRIPNKSTGKHENNYGQTKYLYRYGIFPEQE